MARRDRRAGREPAAPTTSGAAQSLARAVALHQQGRLADARALYKKVLQADPRNADALHLMGVVAKQEGDADSAEKLIRRALEMRPALAQAHGNLGLLLHERGDLDGAESCYREAIRRRPEFAEAHANLGALLLARGRPADAARAYESALRGQPGALPWLAGLAQALAAAGRTADAARRFADLLARDPGNVDAAYNLGILERDLGHLEAARAALEKAAAADPAQAETWYALSGVALAAGDAAAAWRAAARGQALAPDDFHHRAALVAAAAGLAPDALDEADRETLLVLLAAADVDPQPLAPLVAALIRTGPAGTALARLANNDGALGGDEAAALDDPLLRAALAYLVLPDTRLEAGLAALRRRLLASAAVAAGDGLLPLAVVLADYAFMTEYAMPQGDDDAKALDALDLEAPLALAVHAAHRPLHRRSDAAALAARHRDHDGLGPLLRRQVDEPLAEREIAAALPALGAIDDATSTAVRAQYEENPYPRWRVAPASDRVALADLLAGEMPAAPRDSLPGTAQPAVLIAGCGTGRQAILTARTVAGATLLAVDLSRASLAYGKRMADALGLGDNIDFRHGDILGLGTLDRRFDLVECTGVLHHMGDPIAGWRVLRDLLAPRGAMRIALYSETARRHVTAARAFIDAEGFADDADGIRRARAAIAALPADHDAAPVRGIKDFYTLSSCRDLLFHVHEMRFTLPLIAAALDELGLVFRGFAGLPAEVAAGYREMAPDDPALLSLDGWAAFEAAHPDTFAGMYEFWVQRAD